MINRLIYLKLKRKIGDLMKNQFFTASKIIKKIYLAHSKNKVSVNLSFI